MWTRFLLPVTLHAQLTLLIGHAQEKDGFQSLRATRMSGMAGSTGELTIIKG
jgi:hypothetical protein